MSSKFFSKLLDWSTLAVNTVVIVGSISVLFKYPDIFNRLIESGLPKIDTVWLLSIATALILFLSLRLSLDISKIVKNSKNKYIKVRFGIRWEYNPHNRDKDVRVIPRCKKHKIKLFIGQVDTKHFICVDCGNKKIYARDGFKTLPRLVAKDRMYLYFNRT